MKNKKNMMTEQEIKSLEERIIFVLKNIYDPEIPVNIYDLGLIYEINIDPEGHVKILMTLTAPNCPVAESLPAQVKEEVSYLKEVKDVDLEITFEPPWSQDMISDVAKLDLGLM
jgi:FeS assembly SUF system protein